MMDKYFQKTIENLKKEELINEMNKIFAGKSCGNKECEEACAEIFKIASALSADPKELIEDFIKKYIAPKFGCRKAVDLSSPCRFCYYNCDTIPFSDKKLIGKVFRAEPGACEKCRQYDGKVYRWPEDAGKMPKLPIHPNCRCHYENIYGKKGDILTKSTPRKAPVFKGYEKSRYQKHDKLIEKIVADFNAHKEEYSGGTKEQAAKIPDITPAFVKSWMIQETGGGMKDSRDAWEKDPCQVNVSKKDWGEYKTDIGLKKPEHKNEGDLENNIRAGLKYLTRKGFGTSGQPAKNRPEGFFDGWKMALMRYNTRSKKTESGKDYKTEYSERILERANNKDKHVPISIRVIEEDKKKR